MTPVGDQRSDLLHIPDVVLVSEALHRFTGFRIAPVRQLPVAVNGVVTAPLQLVANGSLAGAGEALDQVIPPAHVLRVLMKRGPTRTPRYRWNGAVRTPDQWRLRADWALA